MCEVDAKGNLADFFETGPIGFDPRQIEPQLWAMSMQTEESLKEYLKLQLKVPLLAKIGPLARTFDFVANAAPGVKEILTVGKLCYEVREQNYDLVVVDAAASGHVIGQLAAPQAINELVQVGLVRSQTGWMLDLLSDPAITGAVIVSAPEEMPVNETIELAARMRSETQVDLAAVVVNRVLPELFNRGRGGDLRPAPHRRRRGLPHRRGRGQRHAGARRGPPGGHAPAHAGRAPHPASHRAARHPAHAVPAVPVHPLARGARHHADRRGARRGAGVLMAAAGRRTETREPAKSVEKLLATKEIVICCGSGGVGKTTTAAAMAAMAATYHGGKVLVLTVDPAKRLANALGLEQFGNIETRVPDEAFAAVGVEPRGELWAAMLDTKQSWDDLVERHAPDAATRKAILDNPLYQNVTGKFVQSHDYIAMERLYEIHSSGRYDLIVVDTPPTRNAIDFLEAPERMADFFSSRLLRWLIAPVPVTACSTWPPSPSTTWPTASWARSSSRTSPSSSSSSRRCTAASSSAPRRSRARCPTGAPRSWWSARSSRRRCRRPSSSWVPCPTATCTWAARWCSTRCCPPTCAPPRPPRWPARSRPTPIRWPTRSSPGWATSVPTTTWRAVLREVGESFLNYQVVAKREAELRDELSTVPDVVATVPYFESDIFDLAGLLALGAAIWR